MVKVVICGDCGSKTLTRAVVGACSAYGGAVVIDGDRIYQTCEEPKYLIFVMCTLADLYLPGSIVVFGKALMQIQNNINLNDTICVRDSDNSDAVAIIGASGARAIGCSMSGPDTLSISGFTDENTALVSLRRSIKTAGGIVEPHDFIVRTDKGLPVYPILAASAVLLSGGTVNEGKGITF